MRGNRKAKEVSASVLAMVQACRDIVAAFADGRIPVSLIPGNRYCDIRVAPGFRRNSANAKSEGVLYTTACVAEYLQSQGADVHVSIGTTKYGRPRFVANRTLLLAMNILEGIEEGWLNETQVIQRIQTAKRGVIKSLLTELQSLRLGWLALQPSRQ